MDDDEMTPNISMPAHIWMEGERWGPCEGIGCDRVWG